MKTSWNDIIETEQYLSGTGSSESRDTFEARLLLESSLKENMHWQQAAYTAVQQYGRQKRRAEIEQVAQYILTAKKHTGFRKKIFSLFR